MLQRRDRTLETCEPSCRGHGSSFRDSQIGAVEVEGGQPVYDDLVTHDALGNAMSLAQLVQCLARGHARLACIPFIDGFLN